MDKIRKRLSSKRRTAILQRELDTAAAHLRAVHALRHLHGPPSVLYAAGRLFTLLDRLDQIHRHASVGLLPGVHSVAGGLFDPSPLAGAVIRSPGVGPQ